MTIDKEVEEVEIGDEVQKLFDNHYLVGGKFEFILSDHLKKSLVHNLFSNDDQIAIILNKTNSTEDRAIFKLMQDWRKYFSSIIDKMKSL